MLNTQIRLEVTFFFNLNVIKATDEFLTLTHRKHGELEGCLRVYNFDGVFRRFVCDENKLSITLLDNPCWSASFNYDEEEICINNDFNNNLLTKAICFDEDWDDYEEIKPEIEILFQGDLYSTEEFFESIYVHDLEFIYDHCKITSVQAKLNKIEVDHKEVNLKELSNNLK